MYKCLVAAVVNQKFCNYIFRGESAAWLIREEDVVRWKKHIANDFKISEDDVVIVSWNFMI